MKKIYAVNYTTSFGADRDEGILKLFVTEADANQYAEAVVTAWEAIRSEPQDESCRHHFSISWQDEIYYFTALDGIYDVFVNDHGLEGKFESEYELEAQVAANERLRTDLESAETRLYNLIVLLKDMETELKMRGFNLLERVEPGTLQWWNSQFQSKNQKAEQVRAGALAKLTEEERKVLGLL